MRQDSGQVSDQSKINIRRELRSKRSLLSSTLRRQNDRANGPVVENKWDIPLHGVVNKHGWFTFVGRESLTNFQED